MTFVCQLPAGARTPGPDAAWGPGMPWGQACPHRRCTLWDCAQLLRRLRGPLQAATSKAGSHLPEQQQPSASARQVPLPRAVSCRPAKPLHPTCPRPAAPVLTLTPPLHTGVCKLGARMRWLQSRSGTVLAPVARAARDGPGRSRMRPDLAAPPSPRARVARCPGVPGVRQGARIRSKGGQAPPHPPAARCANVPTEDSPQAPIWPLALCGRSHRPPAAPAEVHSTYSRSSNRLWGARGGEVRVHADAPHRLAVPQAQAAGVGVARGGACEEGGKKESEQQEKQRQKRGAGQARTGCVRVGGRRAGPTRRRAQAAAAQGCQPESLH